MSKELFDPITQEAVTWQPLQAAASRLINPSLGRASIMKIGAFGTCGNPSDPTFSSWRTEHLYPALEMLHLDHNNAVFNPEVAEWVPERAAIESIHMARDRVLAVAVTNATEGHASIMEAGFAAYGGILRGQDVFVYIEDNAHSPVATKVARMLARQVLSATAARYPLFSMTEGPQSLAYLAGASLKGPLQRDASNIIERIQYEIPQRKERLDPNIYLSGTSGQQKPRWMRKVSEIIADYGAPVDDSYKDNWDEAAAAEELHHKLNKAVQLIAITSETESLGALAELGPRMMYGDLAGQSIGVYLELHESSPKSPTNRTRSLALAHLARLREDFPRLPLFVAKDLKQLAIFGLSEYYQHQQLADQDRET